MSLQVWLPLNGNLNNQGLSDVTIASTGTSTVAAGKTGSCTKVTTGIGLGYTPDFNNNGLSFGGWFKFNQAEISTVVSGKTYSSTASTPTGQLIGNSSYGGIGLVWTGNNYYSSNSFTSMSVFATLRTSSVNKSTSAITIQFDTWIHIMLTWNPITHILSLYKDGDLINSQTFNSFSDGVSRVLTLNYQAVYGGNGPSASIPFLTNDVRIYDHCLSPKEVEEISKGLVLHYKLDDSYSENTTNLNTTIRPGAAANVTWGGHVTQWINYDSSNDPVPFSQGIEGDIVYGQNGSTGGGASRGIITINASPSTNYVYSCYIKPSDNFTYTHANFLYCYEYDSSSTKITEYGVFNKNRTIYVGDGWYRCWGLVTTKSNTAKINLSFYTYPTKTMSYLLGGWQIEQKDHMTPFVDPGTTRANAIIYDSSGYNNNGQVWKYNTAGDFLIDASSFRYDSCTYINSSDNTTNTASGTVYIYGNCELIQPAVLTCAFWCKPVAGYGGNVGQGQFSLTNNEIGNNAGSDYQAGPMNHRDSIVDINNAAGNTHKTVSIGFVANEWHHFAIVYDGRYARVYKDGVQTSTADMGSIMALGSMKGAVIGFSKAGGVWRSNKSYYSDFRIYVTALTATQVKELYDTSASVDSLGNIYSREVIEL